MKKVCTIPLMVATANALLFNVAQAQDAAGTSYDSGLLEEVVVTANKKSELMSKVPISIAAYSQELMERRGIRNIEDIALTTPGVKFSGSTFGAGAGTNISIRGISSSSGAATTGIYIDDVPIQIRSNIQTSFGSGFPQVFDLERVEVLRGPQGTLYGAGSQGGTVRFITPTPDANEFSIYARGEVSSTAHGDPSYESGVAVNLPLVEDTLGLRVSAWRKEEGGFVDRKVTNTSMPDAPEYSDVNSATTSVLKAALAWQATDSLTITPSVFYQERKTDDAGTFWSTLSSADDGQFVSGSSMAQPSEDKFVLSSITAVMDFENTTLTSVTSYFDRDGYAQRDYTMLDVAFIAGIFPPYPFIPGMVAPGETTAKQQNFAQEIRLNSNDEDAFFNWTVGGFYTEMKQQGSVNTEDLFLELYLPVSVETIFGIPLTDDRYIFLSANDSVEKQWSVFGQTDLKFTDQLSLTLGLRYSSVDFDYIRTVGGPINYPGFGPDIHFTVGSQSSSPITPKIGVNYQLTDDHLLYASAAKGFRVGGVNPPLFIDPQTGVSCSSIPVPEDYDEDTLWSYEVGAKNRFLGGALRTETSVYYIQWKDIQQFVNPGGCAGNGFRDNLGDATSQGFEFSATGQVTDNLVLSGTVGYVEAEYDAEITSPAGVIVAKGQSLDVTPWQYSLMVDYFAPAFSDGEAYAHVEYQYGSRNDGTSRWEDPASISYDPDLGFDPATRQTNMRIGWRSDSLDVSLFGRNLTDEAPLLSKDHDTAGSPLFYYRTFTPRTFGLTVTYRN